MAGQEKDQSDLKVDTFDELLREIARESEVSPERIEAISTLPGPGDVIDGKFEIVERLGTGGMGTVYSAVHKVTRKRVALKWMLPSQAVKKEAELRFIREAQAAGRIDHPNVVDIYDIGRHRSAYYLVMELLHGEPLSARQSTGPLAPGDAISIMMPVMRGVAAAHAEGVIHRDLKPANVFLCRAPDGSQREPKVLDFGVSKLSAPQDASHAHLTADGTMLGTPSYMAPEQLRAGMAVDHRADIYALGVILYEMLSGKRPFGPMSTSQLIVEIATGAPEPLSRHRPDLPAELDAAVMKALARDPGDRFQDVRELALALEPFGDGAAFDQSGSVRTAQPKRVVVSDQRRFTKPLLIASAVAALAIVAVNAWFALREPEAESDALSPTASAPIPDKSPAPNIVKPAEPPSPETPPAEPGPAAEEQPAAAAPGSETAKAEADEPVSEPEPASPKAASRTRKPSSTPTRKLSIRNNRRASVNVTLKCGRSTVNTEVRAKSQASVAVPRKQCSVSCTGAGDPLCPITLRATADSLLIR